MAIRGTPLALALGCLLGGVACGKGSAKGEPAPTLATEEREHRFGAWTARGPLPVGWSPDATGRLAKKENRDDLEVVVMAIGLETFAKTSATVGEMKEEMERRKEQALRAFAGEKPEIVHDLAETAPGIWTLVTRVRESTHPGQWSYNIAAFHLAPEAHVMFVCDGVARLNRVTYWKAIRDICTGLTFAE